MKKILFLFLLTTFFVLPGKVFANCVSSDPGNVCLKVKYYVRCPADSGVSCCSTDQECADLQSQPTPAGSCVSSDPGNVCLKVKYYVRCPADSGVSCCSTQQACADLQNKPNPSDATCDGGTGISTAIGCIHALSTPEQFLGDILKWAVGVGGGIAFLLIIYAGFMIMTSAGNPERLKAGQELLTSALSGLILLIFSIFILKFIGVDILGLCSFGFGGSCPAP